MATQNQATPDYRNLYNVDQTVSTNVTMPFQIGDEFLSIQVTGRFGATAAQMAETARRTIQAVMELRAEFPRPSALTSPAPAPKAATPQPQTIVGNMPVQDTAIKTMKIARVKIEPQADGKIKVELFAEGHQYADLKMTMGLDATLKALDGTGYDWTAEMLGKVGEYNLIFWADWRNSEKLNSKGNPYKNVVALHQLAEQGDTSPF